jgi:hypothetical protein
MNSRKRQLFGLVLLLAVSTFAALYQWLGPGFVTHDPPPHLLTSAPGGVKLVEYTGLRGAVFPTVILGAVGFLLLIVPRRANAGKPSTAGNRDRA